GVQIGTATNAGLNSIVMVNSFNLGRQSAGADLNYLNGAIDEVAIWNRALSADEINQLNKTNAGNFTIAPQKAITLVNSYPVFAKGKYVVRVGTRNAVIERIVDCL
ncbi:MAG: LamG-like jellyroll fold domain-containing protein, partial [Candidatus Aenigmatarchaeota archaeon]